MVYKYEFAGIILEVEVVGAEGYRHEGVLAPYVTTSLQEPMQKLRISLVDQLSPADGEQIYMDQSKKVYRSRDGVIRYAGNEGWFHMRIQRRGNLTDVQCLRSAYPAGISPKIVLNAMEAEYLIIRRGGLLLHASFIRVGDRAILFTAPSGVGKSTQADLWCRFREAELMNGDRVAVMTNEDGVFACGIPFAGCSGVSKYAKLPLSAIVYLSQSDENTVEKLSGLAAFRKVWEGCSVYVWDKEIVSAASDHLLRVLQTVPVYHLRCRPDREAVDTLFRALKDRGDLA